MKKTVIAALAFVAASAPAFAKTNTQTLKAWPQMRALTADETAAGFKMAADGVAYRTVIETLCNEDKSHQFVIPMTVSFNTADSGAPQSLRLQAAQSIIAFGQELLGIMHANAKMRDMMTLGLATDTYMHDLERFIYGAAKSTKAPVRAVVHGPIVMAPGCNTITDKDAYGEAQVKFMKLLRDLVPRAPEPVSRPARTPRFDSI